METKLRLNSALVLGNISLEEIEKLLEFFKQNFPDAKLIYLKKSPFKLRIVEEAVSSEFREGA
jgi:hypothetical protein